jgi:molybdopterin synthase sulfur carrier subunit
MATLKIATPLRPYTNGQIEVIVTGRNVQEALGDLIARYPTLVPHLYHGDEKLRPFVNLLVGEHNINDLQGLETPVEDTTRMLLIPSIAGGASNLRL